MRSVRNGRGVPRIALALALGLVLWGANSAPAWAQWKGHDLGLGLRLGDPTTLSAKFWLSGVNALQLDLGWHTVYRHQEHAYYYYYPGPVLSVDWVHQFARFGPESRRIWFGAHVGVGGAIDFATSDCYYDAFGHRYCDSAFNVHVPVAFNAYFSGPRLELLVEVAPGVRVYPAPAPTFSFSTGGRFYF